MSRNTSNLSDSGHTDNALKVESEEVIGEEAAKAARMPEAFLKKCLYVLFFWYYIDMTSKCVYSSF